MRVGERGAERPAVLDADGSMRDLSGVVADIGPAFFAGDGLRRVVEAIDRGGLPEARGRIGAPIERPGKVVCIGLNYSDHAAETGQALPPQPVVFLKDPATVVGPFDDVHIPRGSQDGCTAGMIFDVGYLVWYLSQYMVLEPGNLINTGTPAGVALGRADQPYLRPGDLVELEIDQLGRAAQRVVAAS